MKNIKGYDEIFEGKYDQLFAEKSSDFIKKLENNDIIYDVLDELNPIFDIIGHDYFKNFRIHSENMSSRRNSNSFLLSLELKNDEFSILNFYGRSSRKDSLIKKIENIITIENEGNSLLTNININVYDVDFNDRLKNELDIIKNTFDSMGIGIEWGTFLGFNRNIKLEYVQIKNIPIVINGENVVDRSYREGLPSRMIKDFEDFCKSRKIKHDDVVKLADIIKNGFS